MKIGVSYNVFDGEELLESSIKSIRNNVDYISVVYQTTSNFGNPCNEGLVPLLEDLKNRGLVDELFEYRPRLNKGGHFNEITKRNIGLSLSEGAGCTHHMAMDSDEFFTDSGFKYMKSQIKINDYESCVKAPDDARTPQPLYAWAILECADEYSWPAKDLHWVPSRQG